MAWLSSCRCLRRSRRCVVIRFSPGQFSRFLSLSVCLSLSLSLSLPPSPPLSLSASELINTALAVLSDILKSAPIFRMYTQFVLLIEFTFCFLRTKLIAQHVSFLVWTTHTNLSAMSSSCSIASGLQRSWLEWVLPMGETCLQHQ